MAKKKSAPRKKKPDDLPSTTSVAVEPGPAAKPEVSVQPECVGVLALNVPVCDPPQGYRTRRVDVQNLKEKQSAGLYRILYGLMRDEKRLEDGTIVRTPMHAIKWMLERSA